MEQDLIERKQSFNTAWNNNTIELWYNLTIDNIAYKIARDEMYNALMEDREPINIHFDHDRVLAELVLKHLTSRGCTGTVITDNDNEYWVQASHPLLTRINNLLH